MRVILATMIAFLVIVTVGFLRLWIFLFRSRVSVRQSEQGAALHIKTPAGELDLQPRDRMDPKLASFSIYPGAQPRFSESPEYVATTQRHGKTLSSATATYWTPDLSGKVLDYYRAALPGWQQKREWLGGAEHAWEFTDASDPAGTRTIRVRSQYGGTTIENTIDLEKEGEPRPPG